MAKNKKKPDSEQLWQQSLPFDWDDESGTGEDAAGLDTGLAHDDAELIDVLDSVTGAAKGEAVPDTTQAAGPVIIPDDDADVDVPAVHPEAVIDIASADGRAAPDGVESGRPVKLRKKRSAGSKAVASDRPRSRSRNKSAAAQDAAADPVGDVVAAEPAKPGDVPVASDAGVAEGDVVVAGGDFEAKPAVAESAVTESVLVAMGDSESQPDDNLVTGDGDVAPLEKKLMEVRESLNLSIAEVADVTRIRSDYIRFIENDEYDRMAVAPIYVKSYIKTLCRHYGLGADELVAEYERSLPAPVASELGAAQAGQEFPDDDMAPSILAGHRSPAGSLGLYLAWALTIFVVLAAASCVVWVVTLKNRGAGNTMPLGIDASTMTITERELEENFITPEKLPLIELPVPADDL